ncbi:type VI secretion system Vgr family protein [Bordetella sp. N]|uniref:type VI secretion system Vgr family protein n=1 Tax=Bordetella sp. N TaxID=1746199 RepID=UPI00070FAAFB|nr:type VI secretion system Vgr family protein [Bordetella sp. N]ALM84269.1 type IV secretion protein Rhs [Bordetella sp. N]
MPSVSTDLSRLLTAAFEQGNRLLDLSTPLGANRLLAQDMQGSDRISDGGYRLEIRALSDDAHIPLKDLLGQPAQLSLQSALGRATPRVWHGHITEAWFDGANGGLARYRLRLEPWLAFLRQRRDSYVFQDMNVCDIVESIFNDYRDQGTLTPAWRWSLKDRSVYAKRSLTIQYRESDFDFVERLLAEEGLYYWIEHQAGTDDSPGSHTVVIADDNDAFKAGPQESVRFHRADVTETEDTMQRWGRARRWLTNGVRLASWDYRGAAGRVVSVQAPADGLNNKMALLDADYPGQYAFEDDAQGDRLAHNTLAALRVPASTYEGAGTVRTLAAGQRFTLTDHFGSGDGADASEFLVLRMEHSARNNLQANLGQAFEDVAGAAGAAAIGAGAAGRAAAATASAGNTANGGKAAEADFYQNRVTAIPVSVEYRNATVDGHGERIHPRPTILGTQTALVVGADDPVHTDRDHRIRVQFHWQRGSTSSSRLAHPAGTDNAPAKNDLGTWVRVAEPVAGGDWGGHFVPRVGQEVLVQFLHGDVDRPVVVGAVYNGAGGENAAYNQVQSGAARSTGNAPAWFAGSDGAHAHNVVMSGFKSQEMSGSAGGSGGYNQLVMDDTPGQSRLTASTTQEDSRLNLGRLKQQNDNERLDDLGHGAELASKASVAVRGGQGLLISADARPNGSGAALDSSEAVVQLDMASEQAQALAKSAGAQQAKLEGEAEPAELPALKGLTHVGKVLRQTQTRQRVGSTGGSAAGGATGGAAGGATAAGSGAAGTSSSAASSASAGATGGASEGDSATAYGEAHFQVSAPAGIGQYTPASAFLAAGATLAHVAPDVNWSAIGDVVADVAGGVVLYTDGKGDEGSSRPANQKGLFLHAAAGKLSLQAQQDTATLNAKNAVTLSSTHATLQIDASTHILATAGGAYLRLENGQVQLHAPGKVTFHAGSHAWQGPQSAQASAGFGGGPLCDARVRGAAQQGGAVVPI